MILQPHHHEFKETLAHLPFFYQEMARGTCESLNVIQRNPNSVPEIATTNELREYLLGGEADKIVEFVDGYADNDCEENNTLIDWELADKWLGLI